MIGAMVTARRTLVALTVVVGTILAHAQQPAETNKPNKFSPLGFNDLLAYEQAYPGAVGSPQVRQANSTKYWAFQGVATDAELAKQPLLLLDVGGGSTEFILGHGAKKSFAHSFPLGTVRLLEKFPHGDPPTRGEFTKCRDWLRNFLHHEVRPRGIGVE